MRRLTRLFPAAVLLIAAFVGGYTIYWKVAAARLEKGLVAWAQSSHARELGAQWQRLSVGGYPFSFFLHFQNVELINRALTPSPQLRLASLSCSARPWDLRHWFLSVPDGITGELAGGAPHPPLMVSASRASGTLSVPLSGGLVVFLNLHELGFSTRNAAAIGSANLRIAIPAQAPRTSNQPDLSLTANLRRIKLPTGIGALGDRIADLDFGITLNGPVPGGPLPLAAAAWRDAGGMVALDHFHIQWDGLEATATGTFALDHDLQPIGGLTGAVQGYNKIIASLVADGRLRGDKAGLARIVIAMLAKAGPNGRPEIATSLTVQNGKIYLGPARIADAPHIQWR